MLTTQHSLDGGTVEILDDLVDNLCNIPVLGSNLDCSHGDLGGIVGSLDDICGDTLDFGGEDDSLGVGDCVTIELDTEHDLDDIAILEDDLGVGWEGRDVGNDIVDRDGGGECDTCKSVCP